MIIRFFKNKYFIQFAALFLLIAILWIDEILNPSVLQFSGDSVNIFGLMGILKTYPIVIVAFSILLLLLQAIVLNQVLENHRLMERNQLLTAAVYILIISSSPILTNPFGVLLTNFILIVQLNVVLNIYGKKEPLRQIFDAAFLIGVASLLHLPVLVFIIFLWACLVLYQLFTWREWLISIIGITIPHLFAGTYFYWTGSFETEFNAFTSFFTQIHPPVFSGGIYLYIIWGFLTLLTFISLRQISKGLTESTIPIRKKYRVIVFFLIAAFVSAIFAGETLMSYLVIAAIPVSAFIALYLSKTKKTFIPEIIVILLFLSIMVWKYLNLA